MYDMYPWDQLTDARDDAGQAASAVQVALDRRDNGGAASARTPAAAAGTAPLRGARAQ